MGFSLARGKVFAVATLAVGLWQPSVWAQAEPGVGEVPAQPPAGSTADAGAAEPLPATAPVKQAETIQQELKQLVGQPGGLTAEQAAERAVASSQDVRARDADVAAANADTRRVLYTSLPRLNLLARYTRLSPIGDQALGPDSGALVATTDPPGPLAPGAPLVGIPASALAFPEVLNQYLLQASVTVPLSDYLLSTGNAVNAAGANEDSARSNREATKLQVAMRAKLLYYDWVRARLNVVVSKKSVEQSRASLATANMSFAAGRASKADVLNAESMLASAELAVERSRTQAELAEERLRVIMHDGEDDEYAIGEQLFNDEPRSQVASFKSLLSEAKRKRVELRALEEASRSLAERRAVADARALPKLEAFGNAYYARPNQRYFAAQDEWRATWDVGVQLSWSPNDWGTSNSDSHTLEAERAKVQAERERTVDRIQEEVLDAYTSLREAQVSTTTAERNLEAAEEAYRVQKLFYENGRSTTLELLDSEARLLRARVDLINVHVARHMARVALEHAVGRDVPPATSP